MRAPLLVIAVLGFVVAQRPQGRDFCSDVHFKSCTSNLAAYWGYEKLIIWDSPYYLSETVNDLMKSPYTIQNFIKICNGLSLFNQCLTKTQVEICLGPIGWVGRGKSPTIAFAFDGMLSSLAFQCGAGFQSLEHSPNMTSCLQRTTTNYDPEISTFYKSYELNIMNDPSNACVYGQSLVKSIASVYQSGPCRTVNKFHAEWYACEMTRNYIFSQFRHCQHTISCPKTTSDFSDIVRNDDSGEPEFLLPATWRQNAQGEWSLDAAKWI